MQLAEMQGGHGERRERRNPQRTTGTRPASGQRHERDDQPHTGIGQSPHAERIGVRLRRSAARHAREDTRASVLAAYAQRQELRFATPRTSMKTVVTQHRVDDRRSRTPIRSACGC